MKTRIKCCKQIGDYKIEYKLSIETDDNNHDANMDSLIMTFARLTSLMDSNELELKK